MSGHPDPGALRVGTEGREAALAALGEHLVAGRLDLHEYEHRAAAAAVARTYSDLDQLFSDLPPPHPPPQRTNDPPGPGRLPDDLREQVTAEGLLVLATDVPGTLTYHRYRTPGPRPPRTTPIRATIAVSRLRLLIWAAGAKRVDLPFAHPLWPAIGVSATAGRLRVAIDAAAFNPRTSGRIVLRLRTDRATAVADLVAAR